MCSTSRMRFLAPVILVLAQGLVLGLGAQPDSLSSQPSRRIVARVGSEVLTVNQYYLLRENYLMSGGGEVSATQIIDAWIEQELICQEAKEAGLDKVPQVRMELEKLRFIQTMEQKNLLVQAWIESQTQDIDVPQKDIKVFFRSHKGDFLHEVKVSQIIVSDSMLASDIFRKLRQGVDFTGLAQTYTLDTLKGSPTPFMPYDYFPFHIADSVFGLEPGNFTSPLPLSGEIFVIYQLHDKVKVRRDITLEDVYQYIRERLAYQLSEQVLTRRFEGLKAESGDKVEIHLENLMD